MWTISIFILLLHFSSLEALHIGSCLGLVCGRNGHCHVGPVNNTQTTYWCRCDEGYGGDFCERRCELKCGHDEKCIFNENLKPLCVCKDCDRHGNNFSKPNCPTGFGGEKCTTSGWCYPEVCQNGGQCIGVGSRAKCVCPQNFKGERCELDVNECEENPNACGPRSTCMNTNGSYICVCPQGFLPPDCLKPGNTTTVEFKPPVCFLEITPENPTGRSMYCQNGGVCEKSKCHCPPGYYGSTCEIPPETKRNNPCATNPCGHGTCSQFPGGFQCICDDGYGGSYCQEGKDHCMNNKCEAGSECINDVNSYFCDCPPGRTGQYCEKVDCSAVPGICNHGTCIDSPLSEKSFECQCESGYEGELCELDKNECLSENMCLNNGTCVNLPGSFRCDCARGFGGKWCDEPLNMCEDVHCENGGTCMHTSDHSPVCQCKNGYIGKRCEKECPAGFGGVRCDLRLNTEICSRRGGKCYNGGKCLRGFCVCPPDFTGNNCEVARKDVTSSGNTCQSDPCMNNATCIDVDAHIGYACICQQGFEGDICERHKDLCLENPCANGGTCHQNRESFTCECPSGFYGERCENEKKFLCTNSTCLNGGACISDGKSTKCECSYGFTGNKCEEKIDLGVFSEKEKLLRSVCEKRKCSERANDGNCDADCNYAACKFDGGDCSGKQEPFSKCRYGNMCADLFANGICNQACNNEECLYDGMDCMPAVVRCPIKIREHCAARFANGICDPECNINGCGFDGGDCDNKTEATIINDIRITVNMKPSEFQLNGGQSLMEISSALRATVRIQRDEDGPLVFRWDGENEQERVKMDEKKLTEQHVLSTSFVRKIRSATYGTNEGVVVYLEVQENCIEEKCLYKGAQSVVDLISARLAKKGIDSFGVPISEALVATPRRSGEGGNNYSMNNIVLFIGVGCVLIVALAGTLTLRDNRTRKRRMINAPVWIPPMENEDKNRRNQSMNSSQHSLLETSGYYDQKRHRGEFEMGHAHGQYQQFYPYGNGYMGDFGAAEGTGTTTTQLSNEVEEPSEVFPKLHIQAAGSDKITEPITKETVNIVSKYNRTVLHWLAGNTAKKSEDLIITEALRCIHAGAEVNVMDSDEMTPLMMAVCARRNKLALYLLKARADPTIYNKSQRSALHVAAANGDIRIMSHLLTDKRIIKEIDELDINGETALMIVAQRLGPDQVGMAELLIRKGAAIDCDGGKRKDSEIYKGRTALHYAALVGNRPMVEYLIAQNANKDKQDEAGQTPVMLAAKEGHEDIVHTLISNGASVEAVDALDHTARQLAQANGHHKIVEMFDNHHRGLEFSMEMALHHHHQNHQPVPASARKTARPAFKTAKKQTNRIKKEAVSSRDSTHLTPPPSDGSTSSPSPQHFMTTTHTTPTSANYLSPEYQHELGNSDAFQPQCSVYPSEMWHNMSSTYSPMKSERMMQHVETSYHY